MQQLFLPVFRYIKGSITPEDNFKLTSRIIQQAYQEKQSSQHLPILRQRQDNVIRVGGRLANSPYSVDKKFPIIIPKTSPLANLLIQESHLKKLQWTPDYPFWPPAKFEFLEESPVLKLFTTASPAYGLTSANASHYREICQRSG